MSYDTWKTTETPSDDGPREPEQKPCKPCGGSGLDEAGTSNVGVFLKKCDGCGGCGYV